MALALAAAAGLEDAKPYYIVKYIFFDGEEDGMLGSKYYAAHMSADEIADTVYMINLDALAFGDYCSVYGGVYGDAYDDGFITRVEGEAVPEPVHTEGYSFAADTAEQLGFRIHRTAELDGYFEKTTAACPWRTPSSRTPGPTPIPRPRICSPPRRPPSATAIMPPLL